MRSHKINAGRGDVCRILTFVDNALKSCEQRLLAITSNNQVNTIFNVLITLNSRAETAAAAMVHKMVMRRRPLVFLLVVVCKNESSAGSVAMLARYMRTQHSEQAAKNVTQER